MNAKTRAWQASDERLPRGAPRWVAERAFRQGDIPAVRQFTRAFGVRAGLSPGRLDDFVLAASEATASATAAGPCTARIRLWVTGAHAYCEVRSDGPFVRRTAPGIQLRLSEEEALRRWVFQRLSDYVSVASGPDGAWVLLSMTLP